jgi:hypothetical protein
MSVLSSQRLPISTRARQVDLNPGIHEARAITSVSAIDHDRCCATPGARGVQVGPRGVVTAIGFTIKERPNVADQF